MAEYNSIALLAMKSTLVIVETPTKAITLEKLLRQIRRINEEDETIYIKNTGGNIRELASECEHDTPTYNFFKGKKRVIDHLLKFKCDDIIIATDNDQNGKVLAWHLYTLLSRSNRLIKRLVFDELTLESIMIAWENMKVIDHTNMSNVLDMAIVESHETMKMINRVFKNNLSRATRCLPFSVGRNQLIAMLLIEDFYKKEILRRESVSFQVDAYFSIKGILYKFHLQTRNNVKWNCDHVAVIKSICESELIIHPPAPYTLYSLAKEARQGLHQISIEDSFKCLRKLYEYGFTSLPTVTDPIRLCEPIQENNGIRQKLGKACFILYNMILSRYKSESKNDQDTENNQIPRKITEYEIVIEYQGYEFKLKSNALCEIANTLRNQHLGEEIECKKIIVKASHEMAHAATLTDFDLIKQVGCPCICSKMIEKKLIQYQQIDTNVESTIYLPFDYKTVEKRSNGDRENCEKKTIVFTDLAQSVLCTLSTHSEKLKEISFLKDMTLSEAKKLSSIQ